MPLDVRKATGSRKPIQLLPVRDFTGGLNLSTDTFNLERNETPDCENVDMDRRGGFQRRRAIRYLDSTALANDPRNLWPYETSGGTEQVIAQVGDNALYSTGGAFTSIGLVATTGGGRMRSAIMNNVGYQTRNAQISLGISGWKWNGTVATNLTASGPGAWQDDLATPSGTHMPAAKTVAMHMGYLWVANTYENATSYPSRVRWSHPNQPESWRELDYIDIDLGRDGDQITALVPFRDHLLVFKKNSTYAIFGYDWTSFQVTQVSATVGAVSQEAVVTTPYGVYAFNGPDGVWRYDGKRFDWVFEAIFPAMNDLRIPKAYVDDTMLGWVENRLWVSVVWGAATKRTRTFVYDPKLGKDGAWTAYDVGLGPFTSAIDRDLAASPDSLRVQQLEQSSTTDNLGGGNTHIDSYYRSIWFDLGQPAMKKKWKRLEAVMGQGASGDVRVRVYKDYDPRSAVKEFMLSPSAGATAVYGTAVYGTGVYSADGDFSAVEKGAVLGNAVAVQLEFVGPTENVDWIVDAFTLKYIPKRVRN